MFKKILVANRGEIAVRVIRACKEMGIVAAAVYSDADRLALHIHHADEAYRIGPPPSRDSYLAIDRIIRAARDCGAEAVHPGYGFLAENAGFASACAAAGIVFIGPRPESIRRMGRKLESRRAMRDSGVEVVPGSDGAVASPEEAAAAAEALGYPVVIKADAGGGGKGMRVVRKAEDFEAALRMTIGEAEAAFGDASVYLEKYIDRPKHIEIQLIRDARGAVVTLGERECSMQRRYQKVIEEAPSPVVLPELRSALSEAARRVALAVDYLGAGTVEFVMGPDRRFYFLEMNTRLQVEHPVTELVYGIDIVKEQIRVAAGEPLSVGQKDVRLRGHAVEARVYAEDPRAGFLPSTGLVGQITLPEGPGVRNDNGIRPGYEVPVHYDPLLGKVIVWAEDRPSAVRRLRRALAEYRAEGLRTNVEFLLWALDEPEFADGSYDTTSIDRLFGREALGGGDEEIEVAAIAGAIAAYRGLRPPGSGNGRAAGGNPWRAAARAEGTGLSGGRGASRPGAGGRA